MTRGLKLTGLGLGLLLILTAGGVAAIVRDPDEPEAHADAVEHFKYGSIGSETRRVAIPYRIWYVLPRLFADLLPQRPGDGYERFGFVFESASHTRPIGISYRRRQVPVVGLNCAACHTGTIRDAPGGPRRIVLGMPSHQLDLQGYSRFLFAASRDARFNAATLIDAIERVNPDFSWRDRLLYRLLIVPLARRIFAQEEPRFAWQQRRPAQGPGRVDTFNPYKVMFGISLDEDDSIGTADLPPLYHQRAREGMALHWDGNNDSARERNRSAALGAGCTEATLDDASIRRVEDWMWDLRPPAFPAERIDRLRAVEGETLFRHHCGDCHSPGGSRVGKVIALDEIGTDPERLHSFTAALVGKMNTLGTGRPWKFSRFRKTDGYASMLLDGVWLRAPYLHNGSVPTIRDLLKRPEERPTVFYRGYDVYDYVNVGFVSSGADAARAGFEFRTDVRGNSNAGHLYGTTLTETEKNALVEYLKSR